MKLSAIVPTHNRPAVLRQCLETLLDQDVDPEAFEVVVVDDGSPASLEPIVTEVAARGSVRMRCERQPLSGLNTARNRGVAVAQGETLAFLDDDTLVSPGWASALLTAFQDPQCAAVGGRVTLGLPGPAPKWMTSRGYYLAEYELGPEPRWLDGDPVPVGANCAVRRSAFERVGGFRPGLDRIGGSLVSNGDTEFFRRLRATGARLRYEPAAAVTHVVPASRMKLRFFVKRHWAQGISDELLEVVEGRQITRRHRLRLVGGVRDGVKVLLGGLVPGRGPGPLEGVFEIAYWSGRVAATGNRARSAALAAGRRAS